MWLICRKFYQNFKNFQKINVYPYVNSLSLKTTYETSFAIFSEIKRTYLLKEISNKQNCVHVIEEI